MRVRTMIMRRVLELWKNYQMVSMVQNEKEQTWDINFESRVTVRLNKLEYEKFAKQIKDSKEAAQ